LRSRGYNQAEKIADALANYSPIPCIPEALHRERHTRSQVGLNQQERLQNVESAFIADTAIVSGKIVLIVDDVRTTGATLIGCAIALKDAGAADIYALTVTEGL
ncbi:MAG: ComF family protein, partial [Aggregatilineales bacterium]